MADSIGKAKNELRINGLVFRRSKEESRLGKSEEELVEKSELAKEATALRSMLGFMTKRIDKLATSMEKAELQEFVNLMNRPWQLIGAISFLDCHEESESLWALLFLRRRLFISCKFLAS